MNWQKPRLSQLLRFIGAGGIGVSLYYLTLYTLTEFAGVWYLISAVIASILNFSSNFVFQKFWTFKNKRLRTIPDQALQYAVMTAAFFVLNIGLLYVLVESFQIWYLAAQVIVTIVITTMSFYLSREIFSEN